MFFDAFTAEAVVRDAGGQPDAILAAIKSPIHARRAMQLIGSIDDIRLQHAVLARIEDADIIAGCSAGECGAYAQAWARERIDAILKRVAAESDAIAFAIDETCYPAVRRIDPFDGQWTAQDRAVIGALADEFLAGRQVDRMMGVVAALDRKLATELPRLREGLADRKIALRSAMFEFCYVHSQGDAPAIGAPLRRLHVGSWPADCESFASEVVKAWMGRSDLTHGQLYLLLMLNQMAWNKGTILAPFLPGLLRQAYPLARCSTPQDAIKYFITAHIALARLTCDLPGDRPAPQTPAEEALGACGEILYWLNRLDLTIECRRSECAAPLAILAQHEAGVATAVLYELGRCYIGEGLDRLPGATTPTLSLEVDFHDEVAAIFRQCLRLPELQAGYFEYRDLEAILSWAIKGLARVGDMRRGGADPARTTTSIFSFSTSRTPRPSPASGVAASCGRPGGTSRARGSWPTSPTSI